jgi:hypothetical protein
LTGTAFAATPVASRAGVAFQKPSRLAHRK